MDNYENSLAHGLIQHDDFVVQAAGKAAQGNRQVFDGRQDRNNIRDSANTPDLVSQGRCGVYSTQRKWPTTSTGPAADRISA